MKVRSWKASFKGWRPQTPEDLASYRTDVAHSLGIPGGGSAVGLGALAGGLGSCISDCQKAIVETARKTPHTTEVGRRRAMQEKPQALKDAERKAKSLPPGPERTVARRAEAKLKRAWKAQRLLSLPALVRKQAACEPIGELSCSGVLSEDRLAWKQELLRHCKAKYCCEEESLQVQRERVEHFRSMASAARLDGMPIPDFSWSLFLEARSTIQPHKGAGGKSPIVGEMILSLQFEALAVVFRVFRAKYLGHLDVNDDDWKNLGMVFLPKCRTAKALDECRGIALLDVMSKWYTASLVLLARATGRTPHRLKGCADFHFGFKPGHHVGLITEGLRLVLGRSHEWKDEVPLFLFSGDVKAAFDDLSPAVIHEVVVGDWGSSSDRCCYLAGDGGAWVLAELSGDRY